MKNKKITWRQAELLVDTLTLRIYKSSLSSVLIFINKNTTHFHTPVSCLTIEDFLYGKIGSCSFGVGGSRTSLYRSIKKLTEDNILIILNNNFFCINFPGIVDFLSEFKDYGFFFDFEILKSIAKEFKEEIDNSFGFNFPELSSEVKMLLKDNLDLSIKNFKERKRLKNMKLLTGKEKLTTNKIRPYMECICQDLNLTFRDIWSKKDYAIASNWLKLCDREGIDPKELLKKVCENWVRLSTNLKNADGRAINLISTVSFSSFLKNRKSIESWLEANTDLERGTKWVEIKK